MAGSRKKLVTEYKVLLREKTQKIREKECAIHDYISNVSKETLALSDNLLEESDKKLFLKSYQEVNRKLEACLNTLLLVSSGLPSVNTDSSDSSSSSDTGEDDTDDNSKNRRDKTSIKTTNAPSTSNKNCQTNLDPKEECDPKQNLPQRSSSSDFKRSPSQTNSQRKDRPIYQSPRDTRRLLSQSSDICGQSYSQSLNRSQSLECLPLKSNYRSSPQDPDKKRYNSSPGRLKCRSPSDEFASNDYRDSGGRSPESNQRSPTSRRTFPGSKHRSPGSRHRFPVSETRSTDLGSGSSQHQSGYCSINSKNKSARQTSPTNTDESQSQRQTSDSKASPHSPQNNFNSRSQQYSQKSCSPERRPETSGCDLPRGKTNQPGNRLSSNQQRKGLSYKSRTSRPWYTCSSPSRSGDIVKDHLEEKKPFGMAASNKPLVISQEEVTNLDRELASSMGIALQNSDDGKVQEANNKIIKEKTSELIIVGGSSTISSDSKQPVAATMDKSSISPKLADMDRNSISPKLADMDKSRVSPKLADMDKSSISPKLADLNNSTLKKHTVVEALSEISSNLLPNVEQVTLSVSIVNNERRVTSTASGTQQMTANDPHASTNTADIETRPQYINNQVAQVPVILQQQSADIPSQKIPVEVRSTTKPPVKDTGNQQQTFHGAPKSQEILLTESVSVTQTTQEPPQPNSQEPVPTESQLAGAQQSSRPTSPTHPKMVESMVLTHGSVVDVVVSEIGSPGSFFVQVAKSPLEQLMREIAQYSEMLKPIPITNPRPGNVCLACFSQDGCWYRAGILDVAPAEGPAQTVGTNINLSVGVIFFDYGNRERVPLNCIQALNPQFSLLPAQGIKCSLTNVKPAGGSDKWSNEATRLFESLVYGRTLSATVTVNQIKVTYVDLSSKVSSEAAVFNQAEHSKVVEFNVANVLVENGLAQFVIPPAGTSKLPTSVTSRSSSDSAASRSHTLTGSTLQSNIGTDKQEARQTEQLVVGTRGTSSSSTSRSHTPSIPPGFDVIPNQKFSIQLPAQRSSCDTSEKHSNVSSVDQESVKKASIISVTKEKVVEDQQQSQDWREQKLLSESVGSQNQSKGVQRLSEETIKSKPGLTLAQTIAAQASESFDDDARSTYSNISSSSKKTAQCTSSITSMHAAHKRDNSVLVGKKSSQNSVRSRQDCRNNKDSKSPGPNNSNKQTKDVQRLSTCQVTTDQNDTLLLAMSHIVNPNEFYIHAITKNIRKLDFLQDELCDQYENAKNNQDFSTFVPAVGMVCASKYSSDNMWYRVKVLALEERTVPVITEQNLKGKEDKKLPMAQVYFVDFGNTEWVPASGIKQLTSIFFDLPAQAIRCSLAHISPQEDSKLPNFNLASHKLLELSRSKCDTHLFAPTSVYYCKMCCKQLHGTNILKEHVASKAHQENERATRVVVHKPSKVPLAELCSISSLQPSEQHDSTVLSKHNCAICDHHLTNGKEYNDHLNSKDHLLAEQMSVFCDSDKSIEPDSVKEVDRDGWSQMAIDIFTRLAPCENHSMRGWIVKQTNNKDEPIPLVLSYHEDGEEVCINQQLVNLDLAKSSKFQPKSIEASLSRLPDSELTAALQEWYRPLEETGYAHSIIPALFNTSIKSRSQITFILTVPFKKESESITNRQLSMAMAAWGIKNSGYGNDAVEESNQAAAMDSWDPKTSDYFSERNSYEVDDEDATAAVGYSHKLDRKFCKFYMRGQKCYRGDQCPFEHPEPGQNLRDEIPVFFAPTNHSPALPAPDDWVALEVTAIYTPFHFWVQLIWGKTSLDTIQGMGRLKTSHEEENGLRTLEKSINESCKVNSRSEDPNVMKALSEVVIAKFSRNKRWYRARIIDYDETEPCLKVFYVDYGNAEWVPKSSVRSPKPEFLHLPFQAVECFLYGVIPIKEKEDDLRKDFEPLVMDKTLVAHVISSSEATNTMEIQLYNTCGQQDISVGQYLVQKGLANHVPDLITDRSITVSSHRFKRNPELDEPDSVSCHEMQIPG